MNEPARLLQEAFDLLDHGDKWIKGEFEGWVKDEEGIPARYGYCSIGAVMVISRRMGACVGWIYYQIALTALGRSFGDDMPYRVAADKVVRFNDSESTTWEDVALMFKKAINHLDP
jgi:hypothetical protein